MAIAPLAFEEVIKQHCVADLNVTVYDAVDVVDRVAEGAGLHGVLTDGSSRWDLHADVVVDTRDLPTTLSAAITAGAAAADSAIRTLRGSVGGDGRPATVPAARRGYGAGGRRGDR